MADILNSLTPSQRTPELKAALEHVYDALTENDAVRIADVVREYSKPVQLAIRTFVERSQTKKNLLSNIRDSVGRLSMQFPRAQFLFERLR